MGEPMTTAVLPDYPMTFAGEPGSRAVLDGPPAIDVRAHMRVAAPTLPALVRLTRAVRRARKGPGRLTPREFFQYRLWDERFRMGPLAAFVGRERQGELHRACNDPRWIGIADDKIVAYSLLASFGARAFLPDTRRFYAADDRRFEQVGWMPTREEVRDYLRYPEAFPMFGKPVDGIYSLDCFHAIRHDEERDLVVMANGTAIAVEALTDRIIRHKRGFLFQAPLSSHPEMRTVFGKSLCSVRLLVFVVPGGGIVRSAVLKIAVTGNMADNYWRSGNLLAAIDLDTGRIVRVVSGTGLEMRLADTHPDTGLPVVGFALPLWDETLSLVEWLAGSFPGIRTQSWDIAITAQGPRILEINWGGDLHLHQSAHGKGIWDDSFRAHLERS